MEFLIDKEKKGQETRGDLSQPPSSLFSSSWHPPHGEGSIAVPKGQRMAL